MDSRKQFLAIAAKVANLVLAGGGVVSLLVSSYFVYHYSWTGERHFTSWIGMVLYYAVPVVVAGLLFCALRLRLSHKINLALALISVVTSLYAVETIVTIGSRLPSVIGKKNRIEAAKAAKAWGVDYDIRSKREVMTDLRKEGIDAYPAIMPKGTLLVRQTDGSLKSTIVIDGAEVLPLAGISNKTTVFCNENGYYVSYESDEHGFHNPKGIWNSDHVDIVALGDSFTQGFCVPSDKNFVSLIRQRYPATLNLGVAGNGPLLMLAALKEYVQFIKPKVVLWFYFEEDDLRDLITIERKIRLLTRYLDSNFNQSLFKRQTEIDRALVTYVNKVENTTMLAEVVATIEDINQPPEIMGIVKLSQLRTMLGLMYGENSRKDKVSGYLSSGDGQYLFSKVLLEAKALVDSWGGKLYFVYLPLREHYINPANLEKDRQQVLATLNTIGISLIDIHSAFQARGDPLALFPFRRAVHYTIEGNGVVAEQVIRNISLAQ
jgi:hypothetical protein